MTDDEHLRATLESLDRHLELTLYFGDIEGHPLSGEMDAFATKLEASTFIGLRRVEGASAPPPFDGPTLELGKISYHAVPEGPELRPFLEALSASALDQSYGERQSFGTSSVSPTEGEKTRRFEWSEELHESLTRPVELLIFIAPDCPNCPQGVRAALSLALESSQVSLLIVDVMRHEAAAERFGVKSVPMTLIDRELSLVGVTPAATLARHVIERGSKAHDGSLLRSHVESGRLEEASELVQARPGAREELLRWWKQSTLSERIQLMLMAGSTLERSPRALDSLVHGLTQGLVELDDASLRGDTVDLLGQIGHPSALEVVEALCRDENPDVAEIAQEVLEEIRSGGTDVN